MKILLFSTIILLLQIVVFSQESETKKVIPQINWSSDKGCIKSRFTDAQLAKNKIECDSFVLNDTEVKVIHYGGTTVCVGLGLDGDYIVADLYVENGNADRILVDPANSFLWIKKEEKSEPEILPYIPAAKVAEKLRRRVAWANALATFGAAMQTQTTTTQTNGSATVYGNGQTVSGTYNGTSTTTGPDTAAQNRAAAQSRERAADAKTKGGIIESRGLLANTVFPNSSIDGLIYFKKKKAYHGDFVIMIDDVLYGFIFRNDK